MEEILKNADIYFTIDFIATRMEIILNDNKLKFPTKDFKEQENIIKMMRKVELSYLELAEFRRQINKVLKEVYNKNSILEINIKSVAKENIELKKEVEQLKQNIRL